MKTINVVISDIWHLFLLVEKRKDVEFIPHYQKDVGIVYNIPDTDIKLSHERLKRYHESGFLEVKRLMSLSACPTCGNLHLQIQIRCPHCNLQSLKKSELCIHYECGYVGPMNEFKVVNNTFICSKCGKEMKRIGIDYGRPGIGFTCTNCNQVFQYPLALFVCEENHQFKIDEINLISFPVYVIGKELRKMFGIMEHINSLHRILEKDGIRSEIFASINGVSSVNHIIPLLIYGEKKMFAVDFILNELDLDIIVLQTMVRSIDIDAITVLIVRSDLEYKLRDIINSEKIKIIPMTNKDELTNIVIEKVRNIVTST